MPRRSLLVIMMIGVLFSIIKVPSAKAVAYGAAWQTSFTIQNIGSSAATFTIRLYSTQNAEIVYTYTSPALGAGASTSVTARSIPGITGSFYGSATVTSAQPLAVAMVQFAPGIAHRPLSTAIQSSGATNTYLLPLVMDLLAGQRAEIPAARADFGPAPAAEDLPAATEPVKIVSGVNATGSTVIIPTVLKGVYNTNSIIGVQSAYVGEINITLRFYAVGQTTPTWTTTILNQPTYRTTFFDVAGNPNVLLPAGFNGSLVATATVSGSPSTAAPLTALVNEFATNSNNSAAFEGTNTGATTVYMPSAQCRYSASSTTTAYAIQNVSLAASATFSIEYDTNTALDVIDGPYTNAAGGKKSVSGCDKLANGSTGSAIISRTSGSGTLVVVGKVSGGGLSTAFLGFTGGSSRVALPYVRWAPNSTFNAGTRQRTNIAIQNVGAANATGVQVQYIDRNGVVQGTQTLGSIPPGGKVNSDPFSANALDSCGRFGEYGGGADCLGTAFGGGAIVTASSGSLAVLARVYGLGTGEDYSGVND